MLTVPQALALAVQHHQAGNLQQAEQIYRDILQVDPYQVDALHLLGLIAYQVGQYETASAYIGEAVRLKPDFAEAHNNLGVALEEQGKFEEAVACYHQALYQKPHYAEAHNNLGNALKELGQLAEAEASLQQALRVKPDYPEAHNNLGNIFQKQGQLAEALVCYQQALRLKPDYAEAHNNLGNVLKEQGELEEAVASLQQALRLKPDFAEAHNNLGNLLQEQGKLEEALTSLQQALRLKPRYAELHNNLGNVFQKQGQLDEAVASLQQALYLKPDYAEAHNNLGIVLQKQGKLEEAVVCLQQALRLKPDYAEPYNGLGSVLQELGRLEEALASLQQALYLKPDYAEAYNNVGLVLQAQGKLEEALASLQQAVRLKPDYADGHNNLGNVFHDQGQLAEALACYRQALRLEPDSAGVHSNLLFVLHYRAGITLKELAEAHAEYERQHTARLRSTWKPHVNDRDPQRRLRLGFVSPDLGRHPVGYFLIRALEQLDRQQADLVCYSNRSIQDNLASRFQAAATTWWDVRGWNDDRLAEQIRADRIDILFDMAGHTAHNRLEVFARKPAPIQVAWLGYEGTTGLKAMDYLLADRYLIPQEAEVYYHERVLRLPEGYVCYDPPAYAPPVAPLPALASGQVTFGSFNRPAKITAEVICAWAQILERVPQSRLVVKYRGWKDPSVSRCFTERLAGYGIDPGRVECRDRSPHEAMLAEYHGIDLALDPFPFNGGVTTCEALWMGVPVLTYPGETFASRHSLTYLSNLGLTETIASNLEEYVALAVSLAGDLSRLAGLRARLREQMAASPLCDGQRFAANLERLLRSVWQQWLAQNAG